MREIKFRAWDKEAKFMFNVDTLSFPVGGIKAWGPGDGIGWAHVNEKFRDKLIETIVLMQFTGLRDKNGVEIFEGDIVRCWGGEHSQGYWEHDITITIKDLTYDCFMMGELEFLEVIGNIHDQEVSP